MTWQSNLFDNLLVSAILISLIVIIYCRVKNQSLLDVIRDVRQGFTEEYE